MPSPLTDNITTLLSKYLDVQSRRAETVAGNLANADTPGYAAKRLDFTDFLSDAARDALNPTAAEAGTRAGGVLGLPRVVEREGAAAGLDGNNVDSGREMAELSESGMQYLAGTQLLQSRLRTLRAAIREGR